MTDDIEQALSHVDAKDREVWVKMGMALYNELGADGFDIWDQWSQSADNYKASSAKHVWRGFKVGGGVTIGSLYFAAMQNGWKRNTPSRHSRPTLQHNKPRTDEQRLKQHQQTAQKAHHWLKEATLDRHPYLARKGFPEHRALVRDGELLVPMHDLKSGELCSVQRIDSNGKKLFLKGGRTSGTGFAMGGGDDVFFVEGYATALSVLAALETLYRQPQVVVCFSANNLAKVAKRGYVIADNDQSLTGKAAALKTGLPYWMPPTIGMDANDYHQKEGVDALAQALRTELICNTEKYERNNYSA